MSEHRYRWIVIVRCAGYDSYPDDVLEERYTDAAGVIPNRQEEDRLKALINRRYFQRFQHNPERTVVVFLPWFPSDGELPSWHAADPSEPDRIVL